MRRINKPSSIIKCSSHVNILHSPEAKGVSTIPGGEKYFCRITAVVLSFALGQLEPDAIEYLI